MRKRDFLRFAGRAATAAATARVSSQAWSATFMDAAQACRLVLPAAATFDPVPLELDAGALARVAELSGTRLPRGFAPRCERGTTDAGAPAGWVLLDRVVGKYELIDYATGFDPAGAVTGVEIMAYRESHGAEIRTPAWRRQFVGRRAPAQISFEDDIRNISGATMSCRHVTEGVRRLSALQVVALAGATSRGAA